jgi:DNA-binding CsgD family transcriptional regulator
VARTLRGLGVERRIARQPHNKTGWGSLTDAELKVVSLVADGATNAAVAAQQLHLSPHTVETHIRNPFAKLDNHFRAHLMDVMGDSGRPARAEIRRRQLLLRCPCQHESPLDGEGDQRRPQLLAAAVQTRNHCADRNIHDIGNLLVREVFDVCVIDDHPNLLAE